MQNRRDFLKKASLLLAGGFVAPQILSSCGGKTSTAATAEEAATAAAKNIGLQLYSLREMVSKEGIQKVLELVSKMGYKNLESANYNEGKIYDLDPVEFKKRVEDLGMKFVSAHLGQPYSKEKEAETMAWWDLAIETHQKAGAKFMIQPWMPVDEKTTLDDLKAYCDYFSAVGEKAKAAGIIFGYHNHSFEFKKVEDKMIYDFMLDNVNKEAVTFELDVYWAQKGGVDPIAYLKNRPGQFKAIHIKDETEIGASGEIIFEAIFNQMYANGVNDWFVEVERYTNDDPVASVQQSFDFLNTAAFVK